MLQLDLSGKIAVVTGGSGELGRVIVRTLARCGADVAIHYFRHQAQARELLEELTALGTRVMTVQADVTQPESVDAMREAIVHTLGSPHILVNNAVIQYQPWTSVLEQPIADYESQFRSSVVQNVLMAKAFVPEMRRHRYGRFIAISTECVMQHLPGQSAYVAGKRGMDGVLRVLARKSVRLRSRSTRWHPAGRSPNACGVKAHNAREPMSRLCLSDAAVKIKRLPMSWPSSPLTWPAISPAPTSRCAVAMSCQRSERLSAQRTHEKDTGHSIPFGKEFRVLKIDSGNVGLFELKLQGGFGVNGAGILN